MTNSHKIPDRDEEILKILYGSNFDFQNTFDTIIEKQKWQNENFPITIDLNLMEMVESGLFYIHGRDKHLRPIVVLDTTKLMEMKIKGKLSSEILVRLTIFTLEYIKKYMLLDERVENHVIIIDCSGLSMLNTPYSLLKEAIQVIRLLYHCSVHSIYCLNSPVLFSTFMSYLMDESTLAKISIEFYNLSTKLLSQIDENQLE